VEVLPPAEAVGFLRARTGGDDPVADELAEALGDLPLALEQAAAYLEQTQTSLGDYLGLLHERTGELLGLGELTHHPDTWRPPGRCRWRERGPRRQPLRTY
jgi:hypothetical protein